MNLIYRYKDHGYPLSIILMFMILAAFSDRQHSDPVHAVEGIPQPSTIHSFSDGVAVTSTALDLVGSPYRYGGCNPSGFDCSGLVYHVFGLSQIALPRSSRQQNKFGRSVKLKKAKPGDLAFFKLRNRVDHVGIVTKMTRDGLWVVHSTTSRGVVHEDVLALKYWNKRFAGVRRVL